MMSQGLEQVFQDHREQLLRYLRAHGAGDAAEDCLQELWLKISGGPAGPVGSPRSYLFRAATNLMIDRRRAEMQSRRRDQAWSALADRLGDSASFAPGQDRELDGRRTLAIVEAELAALPERALAIFREHRIDGRTQRQIAEIRGLSASTIESDLRLAYRCLDQIRKRLDEE
jgi:RNA polymerase sigma-70 factor (ECF subfamily)